MKTVRRLHGRVEPGQGLLRFRPQRWADAVDELRTLQEEYNEWLEMLPDNLRDGRTAEMLQEIGNLDLESIAEIELPQGFGRD